MEPLLVEVWRQHRNVRSYWSRVARDIVGLVEEYVDNSLVELGDPTKQTARWTKTLKFLPPFDELLYVHAGEDGTVFQVVHVEKRKNHIYRRAEDVRIRYLANDEPIAEHVIGPEEEPKMQILDDAVMYISNNTVYRFDFLTRHLEVFASYPQGEYQVVNFNSRFLLLESTQNLFLYSLLEQRIIPTSMHGLTKMNEETIYAGRYLQPEGSSNWIKEHYVMNLRTLTISYEDSSALLNSSEFLSLRSRVALMNICGRLLRYDLLSQVITPMTTLSPTPSQLYVYRRLGRTYLCVLTYPPRGEPRFDFY